MNVRLNEHGEQLLKAHLAQGRYHSAAEVIERALEALNRESTLAGTEPERKSAEQAVADISELRKGVNLGGLKIKDLIHEGHRI